MIKLFRVLLPWAHLQRLADPRFNVYEPLVSGRDPIYAVPVGQKSPHLVSPVSLPGWERLTEEHRDPFAFYVTSESRPWVYDHGADWLGERLDRCRAANVGPDHALRGCDLALYIARGAGESLVLHGVSIEKAGAWSPIPSEISKAVRCRAQVVEVPSNAV